MKTVVTGCKHGLQASEVGTAAWYHQAGMKKLAVKFLNIVEDMCQSPLPFHDHAGVLLLFDGAK